MRNLHLLKDIILKLHGDCYFVAQFKWSACDKMTHIAPYLCLQNVMRFWLDRGVDGFRINSVAFLYENPDLSDEKFDNVNCDWTTVSQTTLQLESKEVGVGGCDFLSTKVIFLILLFAFFRCRLWFLFSSLVTTNT